MLLFTYKYIMKKIIFTGGGTGGHIYPNLAIIDLIKDNYEIAYIGSKNSLEEKLTKNIVPFYSVTTVKLKRTLSLDNLLIPFKLLKGINEAKRILKKEKPDLVFSKGGFVSVPVVIAASKLKIPCITHESDLTLGLANKLIKNKCKYVLTSFESTAKSLKNGVFVGSPIRKNILKASKQDFLKEYKITNSKPNLLIVGGSLGSKNINNVIFRSVNELCKNYNVFHIVGKGNTNFVKHENYYQIEYATNIETLYAGADVIITRGGSNALFEILTVKKPMIIIPLSKQASRGDQILNANYLKGKNLASVILEEDLNENNLIATLGGTLKNREIFIYNMSKIKANGNDNIIDIIKKVTK